SAAPSSAAASSAAPSSAAPSSAAASSAAPSSAAPSSAAASSAAPSSAASSAAASSAASSSAAASSGAASSTTDPSMSASSSGANSTGLSSTASSFGASSTAIPSSGMTNGTMTTSPSTSSIASSASARATSAPNTTTVDGVTFVIQQNTTYIGQTYTAAVSKRAGQTLADCLAGCAANSSCQGTAFNGNDETCTFYSYVNQSTKRDAPGITFALVESRSNSTSSSSTASTASGSISLYQNSTATTTSSSSTVSGSVSASASTGPESLICPKLDGAVIASALKVGFAIECNHGIIGTTLEITVNSKRQAVSLPSTLSNCVDVCSTSDICVGTTFETSTSVCTYYSAIQSTYIDAGLDSALRIGSNSGPEATTTV
ncbi:hypothetical protein KCU89_g15364, partial [Aureobasidium melanogenum]